MIDVSDRIQRVTTCSRHWLHNTVSREVKANPTRAFVRANHIMPELVRWHPQLLEKHFGKINYFTTLWRVLSVKKIDHIFNF